jgi:NitT/TauT family transport system substrate-binding protein
MNMMKPASLAAAALAFTAIAPLVAARAADKITIGCTATTDCAAAAVAVDEGIFKKNGVDAQMLLIGLNSNIPAALLSNSIQIGGPTPSVFLQAVDGGLDLVAVAGASVSDRSTADTAAVVARPDSGIKTAKDFVGKKVGAPGIGAFLQVLFSQWLIQNGVDPKQVNFVEVTFPTMTDILKSGAVDAVVTAGPIMAKMLSSGVGVVVSHYLEELPDGEPQVMLAATRDWANPHKDELAAVRKSLEEAAKIVNSDPEKGRKGISGFTKIPLKVLDTIKVSVSNPNISKEQLDWWVDVMNKQGMLQNKAPDTANLIAK